MVSTKLHTLRDMTEDSYVDPSSLTTMKEIGAGAFATGGRTRDIFGCMYCVSWA
jgi:hypothetical protein